MASEANASVGKGRGKIDRAGLAPFQIRSQALRRPDAFALPDPLLGFGLPDTTATEPSMGEDGRKAWRESDVTRALRAAEKARLGAYRVEIAPDGTIAIVVGASGDAAPGAEPPSRAG